MIPISNVARHNSNLLPDIMASIEDVIRSGHLIKGPALEQFELEWSQYHKIRHAIGVGSGTDALYLALRGLGVGPGDEVITTAMSFLATAEAIAMTGARPVFVDIEAGGRDLMDISQVQARITPATKAIVAVHLHGFVCDMNWLGKIAETHRLYLVEDCAQAHGADWHNPKFYNRLNDKRASAKVGTLSDIAAFSFFPTKNLGCVGDGGAILTNSDVFATRIRQLREHGCRERNNPDVVGCNSRLDAIQAAVLSAKLPYLDEWNAIRRKIAELYLDGLSAAFADATDAEQPLPYAVPAFDPLGVYHHFPVRVRPGIRDRVIAEMRVQGVECIPYYNRPLPMMRPWEDTSRDWGTSEAYAQAQGGLSLPISPDMSELEVAHVAYWFAETLKSFQ